MPDIVSGIAWPIVMVSWTTKIVDGAIRTISANGRTVELRYAVESLTGEHAYGSLLRGLSRLAAAHSKKNRRVFHEGEAYNLPLDTVKIRVEGHDVTVSAEETDYVLRTTRRRRETVQDTNELLDRVFDGLGQNLEVEDGVLYVTPPPQLDEKGLPAAEPVARVQIGRVRRHWAGMFLGFARKAAVYVLGGVVAAAIGVATGVVAPTVGAVATAAAVGAAGLYAAKKIVEGGWWVAKKVMSWRGWW